MYYRDKYGLMMQGDLPEHDCIGRTFMAYVAYGPEYTHAIRKCINNGEIYRHPIFFGKYNSLSRDHFIYTCLAAKIGEDYYLQYHISKYGWRISDKFTHTIDSYLWTKAVLGSRIAKLAYLIVITPIILTSLRNLLINRFFSQEMSQSEWMNKTAGKGIMNVTNRQKWWRKRNYKTYVLHIQAWMLFVLPGAYTRLLQRVLLKIVPRHNYVIKSLLGGSNDDCFDIENYKPMSGGRWTTTLNETNDRIVRVIESEIELDKDYMYAVCNIRNS